MTLTDRIRSRLEDTVRDVAQSVMALRVQHDWWRARLNDQYNRMSAEGRMRFHRRYARIFRGRPRAGVDAIWTCRFNGRTLRIPLSRERFWLEWDTATSVLGHDLEVKHTYQALINSSHPPELFLDVGANYGTHSLLFLAHGIETMTFEPNPACHEFFLRMCEMNNVTPRLEPVALGSEDSVVRLSYPESDTWLGSTDPDVVARLASRHALVTHQVRQRMLDEYLPEIVGRRTLIKLDTEGNELAVLQGAQAIIEHVQPQIIFECWDESARRMLFAFFAQRQYALHEMPWMPGHGKGALTAAGFQANTGTNFIAIPGKSAHLLHATLQHRDVAGQPSLALNQTAQAVDERDSALQS